MREGHMFSLGISVEKIKKIILFSPGLVSRSPHAESILMVSLQPLGEW
jgi:hypothetical protein